MLDVLESLKQKQILYSQNVIQVKQGIKEMYPHASAVDKAQIFSNTIHKILERNLNSFDPNTQRLLKDTLVKHAIQTGQFDINAYDILENYVLLDLACEENIDALINWLNTQQSTLLSKEDARSVVSHFTAEPLPALSLPSEIESCSDSPASSSISSISSISSTLSIPPAPSTPTVPSTPILSSSSFNLKKWILVSGFIYLTTICSLLFIITHLNNKLQNLTRSYTHEIELLKEQLAIQSELAPSDSELISKNHLQPHLQYKDIDEQALKTWLTDRESLLAEDYYFSSILTVAEEFHINPLLMFAITGQEQGFVKKTHPQAQEIANNPFNVFGSWEDFNTDILDTSRIAARTILNLSKGCPEDADPIKWLNQKYAEDPNWHVGVSQILDTLEEVAGN